MQYTDIQTTWQVVSSLLAAVVLFAGAAAAVYKFVKWAGKPVDDNTARITAIEERQSNDNRRIKRLEQAIDASETQQKLLMRGVMQMMTHMIDGNHTEQLKEVRDDFESYLINK